MARPTATSAAAMTNTKTTNTLPRSSTLPARRENATSARLAALSMSSTHMRMTTALRRTSTPVTPRKNRIDETAMKAPTGIFICRSALADSLLAAEPLVARAWSFVLVPLHQHDRADHRGEEQHRRELEREREVLEHARRQGHQVPAPWGGVRAVAEREREQRYEDGDRRHEERGPWRLLLEKERVGAVLLRREHHSIEDQDGDRADVDEHLESGDRLGAEEHEHPGIAEEGERHEQRRARDAVQEHHADGPADDADREQGEEDRLEEVVGHLARPFRGREGQAPRLEPLAKRDQAAFLKERDKEHDSAEHQPVGYRDRHVRAGERQQQDGRDHQIEQRDRDEQLPAERHELVDAEARQRGADPHEDEHEEVGLKREPEHAERGTEERVDVGERPVPAAEPERGDDRRDHGDLTVFGDEEEAPAHARVLREKARDKLGLGLGEVEGDAVRLREPGDEVRDEGERHDERVDVPASLGIDDLRERERADEQHDRDERQDLRDLVRDQLTSGAQAADERVLVVRGPTGEDDPEHGHRTERREIEEPDVQIRADDTGRERDDHVRREHRAEDDRRRREEEPVVGQARADVLLTEQLDRVSERLEQSPGTGVDRADAVLDDRLDLSLEVDLRERAVEHQSGRERDGDDQAQHRPDRGVESERADDHGSAAPRVTARRKERLSEWMAGERFLEEDAAQIGMTVELDAEHVVRLTLGPVRAFPQRDARRHVRIELGARRAQHHEDVRLGPAKERDALELGAGVHTRVDGVEVTLRDRVIANDARDLEQPLAIDVDHEHVVKLADLRAVAETFRERGAGCSEIDARLRCAQYQFKAFFFHA